MPLCTAKNAVALLLDHMSVLRVTDRPDWLACLDSPTAAPAWPRVLAGQGGGPRLTPARLPTPLPPQDQDSGADGPQLPPAAG